MDMVQLKNFQVIARRENLTRAAEQLNMSQPALSVSLSRLESELRVSLFDRVGRRLRLNGCGRIFLEYADTILQSFDNAKTELASYLEKANKALTIYITSKRHMDVTFFKFSQAHPDITLRRLEISVHDIEKALQSGECDFISVSDCHIEDYHDNIQVIAEEPMLAALPLEHPLARGGSVDLSQLDGEGFITTPEGYATRKIASRLCREAGIEFKVAHECFPCQFLGYVANGVGVAFITDSMLNDTCIISFYADKLRILPVTGANTLMKTGFLWPRGRKLSREAQSFLDFLRAADFQNSLNEP